MSVLEYHSSTRRLRLGHGPGDTGHGQRYRTKPPHQNDPSPKSNKRVDRIRALIASDRNGDPPCIPTSIVCLGRGSDLLLLGSSCCIMILKPKWIGAARRIGCRTLIWNWIVETVVFRQLISNHIVILTCALRWELWWAPAMMEFQPTEDGRSAELGKSAGEEKQYSKRRPRYQEQPYVAVTRKHISRHRNTLVGSPYYCPPVLSAVELHFVALTSQFVRQFIPVVEMKSIHRTKKCKLSLREFLGKKPRDVPYFSC
jgi:hypothetical protein